MARALWGIAGLAVAIGLVALAVGGSFQPHATELIVRNWNQMLRRNFDGDSSIGLHTLRAQAAFSALGSLQAEADQLSEENSPKLKNADAKFSEAFGKMSSLEKLSKQMKQERLRALAEKPAGSRSTLQSTWQTTTLEPVRHRRVFARQAPQQHQDGIALPPFTR